MSDFWYGTSGPRDAQIMLVGESWGFEESAEKRPFVGTSGAELRRMLAEAGIDMDACFLTNVVPARPQNNEMFNFFYPAKGSPTPALRGLHPMPIVMEGLHALEQQIAAVRPKVIVAVGNYALWALTLDCAGYSTPSETEGRRVPNGIMQWRGSQWYATALSGELAQTHLVPIIHPSAILRAWYNRACTVHDLRQRVRIQGLAGDWRPNPARRIFAPPTYTEAVDLLSSWIAECDRGPMRLLNDVETARGLLTCIGFCDGKVAMAIPFIRVQPGQPFQSYWSASEELTIMRLVRTLLSHPNCVVEGQNYLYDMQYIIPFLACVPNFKFDSMSAQHLLFPGTPKALDYLSSLYCQHHWYWKEDHKEWDMRGTIEDLLIYNCEDTLRNFEVVTVLRKLIVDMGQERQWTERMENNYLALDMMRRGVRIDQQRRAMLLLELSAAAGDYGQWFESIIPQRIATPDKDPRKVVPWYQSPTQQKRFFSEDLGLRLPKNRKTERETFGHEALAQLTERHPEFTKLFNRIEEFRSIRVFKNTFVEAPLDFDGRMRCMFNTSGTETFRWSSSENAFGGGTNLQNIPKGEEE